MMLVNQRDNGPARVLLLLLTIMVETASAVSTAVATKSTNSDACANWESDFDTVFDYKYWVQCTTPLKNSVVLARLVLLLLLVLLLYLLSSTADAFFCPVLQTIVEKYRIPPDIAGVTFLSFGNGSPDVFSNIAAFTSSTPNIGVASILGGGLLVTTVIVASVGLVSHEQEQLIPRKFVRDVAFYFIAVLYFAFVFADGTVHLMEALVFLCIYCIYVTVVFLDRRLSNFWYKNPDGEDNYEEIYDDGIQFYYYSSSSHSSSEVSLSDVESQNSADASTPLMKRTPFEMPRMYGLSDPDPSDSLSSSSIGLALARKSSAPTPRSKKQPEEHHDLGPLFSRKSLLERTDTYLRRPASVCVSSMRQTRKRKWKTAWESVEMSSQFGLTARRWTRSYQQLSGIQEFPSVSEADAMETQEEEDEEPQSTPSDSRSETATDRADVLAVKSARSWWRRHLLDRVRHWYQLFERFIWNPFEFVTTFIRRLTIPLVDEETWDKNFAVVCPPFAILLIGTSVFGLKLSNPYFMGAVVGGGGFLSVAVEYTTSSVIPPEGIQLAPYICLAFVMSVLWIMNIANELLAVLETLGGLFGISNSVLGVSVLAWGNSIGDLISNTSIARDGFPTMAFAGCFAGPMFNLLMGIGLSLTIAVLTNGPISMGKPSPLVYLGFGYLLFSLLLNLVAAACDDFRYRPRLCYTLLLVYASFAVISIILVCKTEA